MVCANRLIPYRLDNLTLLVDKRKHKRNIYAYFEKGH